MQRTFSNYTKSLFSKIAKICLSTILFSLPSYAEEEERFIDNIEITLEDGRTLRAVRKNDDMFDLEMRSTSKELIWKKRFGDKTGNSRWHYMYFVRVQNKDFIKDIDHDGHPEIVVGSHCGGNVTHMYVDVYSVFYDHLSFRYTKLHNVESGEPLLH